MLLQLQGRSSELDTLMAAFARAQSGKPQLVWLEGEPGSGKTRLLQEFYAALREQYGKAQDGKEPYWPSLYDAKIDSDSLQPIIPETRQPQAIPYLWWALRCTAGAENNPESLQAYVDGVDELSRHLAGLEAAQQRKKVGLAFAEGIAELLAGTAAALKVFYGAAKLLKKLNEDLRNVRSGLTLSGELRSTITSTEEVFLRLISAINADEKRSIPLVLLIDDAQWMDARSVAFTRRLLQQSGEGGWKVLVLLSLRDTELATQLAQGERLPATTLPELRSSVIRSFGASAFSEVNLPPELDAHAARQLLTDAFQRSEVKAQDTALDRLLERAGGQPYYLLNYAEHAREMKWLDEHGALTCSEDELAAVPRDIRELLVERLRRLPTPQAETLQWGSVQGRRFMAGLVRRVAEELGRNPSQAVLELGSARDDHHLISSAKLDGAGSDAVYDFAHRLVYEEINSQTPPELRALVEGKLNELLAEYFDAGKLDELPLKERRSALEALANAPLDANDAVGRKRLAQIAGQLCREYALVQDYRAAEPWALRLWESAQAQVKSGEELSAEQLGVLDEAFNVLKIRGSWDVCLAMQELLLAEARRQGNDALTAEALRNIGRMKEKSGELEHARELYTEGLELARRCGAAATGAKIVGQLGGLKHYEGDYPAALELYGESLAELRRLEDHGNVVRTMNNMALVLESQGEYAKALAIYDEILADRKADQDELEVAQIKSNIGNLHFEQGDYDRAFVLYSEALTTLQQLGDEVNIAAGLANVGAVHEKRGEYELALRLYDESLGICRRIGTDHGAALTLTDIGSASQALGKLDHARASWTEAARLYRECGMESEAVKVDARLAGLGETLK